MGANVTIITPESWHLNWPLQEADVQFLGIGTLSQVKQSTKWVECLRPEGQRGRLRPYVANIAVNLWGHDLLQQWNTQINISVSPKMYVSWKRLEDIKDKGHQPFSLYENTKQLTNLQSY